MGDSDDEYDRRRARDKFRRERSDYQERRDDRNRREDFPERESWSGRERSGRNYRDYDPRGRHRERYNSPPRHELSPPMKRMRRDWDDRGGYGDYDMPYGGSGRGGGMMSGGGPPGWGSGMPQDMAMMHNPHNDVEPGLTQPLMMTFKQFLGSQDDGIDDQEAVKKYNEYKIDFKRQQVNEFFLNHKEEEWFKSKYHPEECGKRQAEQLVALKKRMATYMELLGKEWIEAVSIDVEKSEQIVRLLDAVVIKLEGGTDNDLKFLDEPYEEEKPKDPEPFSVILKEERKKDNETKGSSKGDEDLKQGTKVQENAPEEDSRRKRYQDGEEDSSSESDSENEDGDEMEGECAADAKKKGSKVKKKEACGDPESPRDVKEEVKANGKGDEDEEPEDKNEDDGSGDGGEDEDEGGGQTEQQNEEEGGSSVAAAEEEEELVEESEPRPRPLHKTCSIFLRNLAPTITKQEVEAMCKRYSGFLRVAIADPQPERRFFRRGWVTFERTVNIKEICWNLNNIRLRECELGAIVNRDLSRRIRSVNGIASHKQVVRSDIKLSARIIQNLDNSRGLWLEDGHKDDQDEMGYEMCSKNPLLKNITDYLIEEASAEEEELMGTASSEENKEGDESGATLVKDEMLIKVLDRLLLYLRIVHSVDYYNHSEYPNEDEMPNRCGIMHARGSPPTSKVVQQEIGEYLAHFEQKIGTFLKPQTKLEEAEAVKLGKKNPDAEVEKFIQANTQELAKDKWLCPLSGKKFKGPEFVRKHIYNKHGEKVDEVKREVEYFNNYLVDAKRPQLPEHPANRQQNMGPGRGEMGHMGGGPYHGYPPPPFGGFPPRGHPPAFQGGYGGGRNYPEPFMRSGNFGGKRNYGRSSDPRGLISYRDLDAPHDMESF